MVWRKRLTRGLVALALLAAGFGYFAYQRWTDPALVRDMVLAALSEMLPHADVRLDGAELEFLGRVSLRGLTLTRRDDPAAGPIALLPEITLVPDKQELSRGRLVLRKVAIYQPRLTLVHRADGTWNFSGLIGESAPRGFWPLIEVRRGTLVIVDAARQVEPITLHSVDLTLYPGEGAWCRFQATGRSDLLGDLECQGNLRRETGEVLVSFRLPDVSVSEALFQRAAAYWPELERQAAITGRAELSGEIGYHPQARQPLSYLGRMRLHAGRIAHPKLPAPLEDVSLLAHLEAGQLTLERLEARFAGGLLQASGEARGLSLDGDWRVEVKAERLQLEPRHYAGLPPHTRELCEDFDARGTLSLQGEMRRASGKLRTQYVLRPQGMAIRFDRFPYPVDKIVGTLAYREDDPTPTLKVNLTGMASGRHVKMTGEVTGDGLRPDNADRPGFNLEITGANLPIDDQFLAALEPYPRTRKAVADLNAAGQANVVVRLRREANQAGQPRSPLHKHVVINFHHGRLRYADFPYPLEMVEGWFELFADESWRFYDCKGRHKDGEFTGVGQSMPVDAGHHLSIEIRGVNALLDDEMERALDEEIREAWQMFRPSGRANFVAKIVCPHGGKPELDLLVAARGCAMKPTCFPYELSQVVGSFHYAKNVLVMTDVEAQHERTRIRLPLGEVTLRPKNGYRAVLKPLWAENLVIDDELLQALPKLVRRALANLRPDQPIRLVTHLTLDDPGRGEVRYEWDGHVALANTCLQLGLEATGVTGLLALRGSHDGDKLTSEGNLQLDDVTIATLPLRNLRSKVLLTDDSLVLQGINASLHDGQLYGPIRIRFGATPEYQIDLTASRIDLEGFARQSLGRSGQVKGRASGQLSLTGRGDDLTSLRGTGWVHVDDGARLYDLPPILSLLNALSGHLPKNSAFQEAHADVVIEGEQLKVTHLELLGDALSLRGQGKMRVDGSDLNLEMYGLLWGRTLPLLPPLIDKIPVEVSKQLMRIRMVGSLANPETRKEPVPIVVEPIRELWQKMAGRRRPAVEDVSTTPPKRLP